MDEGVTGTISLVLNHLSWLVQQRKQRYELHLSRMNLISSDQDVDSDQLMDEILDIYPEDAPGYTADWGDGPTAEKHHWPMIYSLLASAEAKRAITTNSEDAELRARYAAQWLFQNRDLNQNGIVGWGLPIPYDPGANGIKNPAHTEYAITTAIAVRGLLDVYDMLEDFGGEAPNNYLKASEEALLPYVDDCYTSYNNGRSFWYTTRDVDDYDIINSTSMVAGIMQRVSQYLPDSKMVKFSTAADEAVEYILSQPNVGPSSSRHWLYYGDKLPASDTNNEINDILHHAYILDGLLTYKGWDGRNGNRIPINMLDNSLRDFKYSNSGLRKRILRPIILEYPNEYRKARIWGHGYFLYVLAKYFEIEDLIECAIHCANNIPIEAATTERGPTKAGVRSLRHYSHLLLGLAEYTYFE